MELSDLPTINACLNLLASLNLLLGYLAIKKGKRLWHKRLMLLALMWSALFLSCYLIYHYNVGSKKFPELGWLKTLYLSLLIPHTVLATVMVPMILMTFYRAFRQEWDQHKKIARWTFPIWMYVSVTGVIIYLMLYHLP